MTTQRFFHSVGMLCLLLVLLIPATHCSKDYSYEGGPLSDTALNVDTISAPAFNIPTCLFCNNTGEVKPNTWMFTINGTVVCGNVTRAIKNMEGTAMTFFGPSDCSPDTGLIITAYFKTPILTANSTNQSADRVGLEYYDKVTPSQIAAAQFTPQFGLIIQHYNRQTGVATGTFTGQAVKAAGTSITIAAGKFNIKIE